MPKWCLKIISVTVDASRELKVEAPFEYVRKMRASVLVMGSLLARNGRARVALPGGCAIGSRPIDQHLKGFEAMGAKVKVGNGFIEAEVKWPLTWCKNLFGFPKRWRNRKYYDGSCSCRRNNNY